MPVKLGIIMDPIETIKPYKDSSFAMLLAAQKRGWQTLYMRQQDLAYREGKILANSWEIFVTDNSKDYYSLSNAKERDLAELDIILMRKDPPFDMEYIYTTYMLDQLEKQGVLVVNRPQSLRDVNEKYFTTHFPQCSPPQVISQSVARMKDFLAQHQDIVVKPLDGMGGASIFRIKEGDLNTNVILETVLNHGKKTAVAQKFLPEYSAGDKRILVIDGEPIDYALARIPAAGEARANLAAGASWEGAELTERDRWICAEVGNTLKEKGLIFVGLDVIGDYLTEINVTSPTCIRELDTLYNIDIAGKLMDCLACKIAV
jgi:glutathione synthase